MVVGAAVEGDEVIGYGTDATHRTMRQTTLTRMHKKPRPMTRLENGIRSWASQVLNDVLVAACRGGCDLTAVGLSGQTGKHEANDHDDDPDGQEKPRQSNHGGPLLAHSIFPRLLMCRWAVELVYDCQTPRTKKRSEVANDFRRDVSFPGGLLDCVAVIRIEINEQISLAGGVDECVAPGPPTSTSRLPSAPPPSRTSLPKPP